MDDMQFVLVPAGPWVRVGDVEVMNARVADAVNAVVCWHANGQIDLPSGVGCAWSVRPYRRE